MTRLRGMASAVELLSLSLQPQLKGLPPEIVGAALADLTAIWIAGHHKRRGSTTSYRRELFDMQCQAIWQLVEHYTRQQGEPDDE